MLAHGLQSLAQAGFGMAIVDDKASAAVVGDAPPEINCRGVGAPFEDRARARRPQGRWQQRLKKRHRFGCDREGELPVRINLDPALVPAPLGLDGLVDRQRVEKFIGKNDGRTFRYVGESGVPKYRDAGIFECLFLLRSQRRTDFDQVCYDRSPEFRHDLHRAQGIFHHRAAARTKFDQSHVFWRAHLLPPGGDPEADQLSEHLTDFRSSDEIAAGAKRIMRGVVAMRRVKQA